MKTQPYRPHKTFRALRHTVFDAHMIVQGFFSILFCPTNKSHKLARFLHSLRLPFSGTGGFLCVLVDSHQRRRQDSHQRRRQEKSRPRTTINFRLPLGQLQKEILPCTPRCTYSFSIGILVPTRCHVQQPLLIGTATAQLSFKGKAATTPNC